MFEDRIKNTKLLGKIMSVEDAASLIMENMTVCFSGFTAVGYPKAIPLEIARQAKARNLKVIAGASTGRELDGALANAGLIGFRTPFNVNKDLRNCINQGKTGFADQHLGHIPQMVRSGIFGKIDYAVIECCGITEDNGIIPTLSVGSSNSFIECADRIILELNLTHPVELFGIHDIYNIGKLPTYKTVQISEVGDHIGEPVIHFDPEKIAGIVIVEDEDQEPRFVEPDTISQRIAENIIRIIKKEISEGRLPENFTIQSGFGAVANAVLYGLGSDDFGEFNMFTEVVQDGALELILKDKIRHASATSLCFSKAGRKKFYNSLDAIKDRFVIRPQDISNNGGLIRSLGVVAMNTAVEVDIYGNINSTHSLGSSIINGLGGSGDFARNSLITIFMTPSTAKNGNISSIVPMVSHVDHTEHDSQFIVTEYGYADLRGKTPKERAELIIENCCHPDYKPLLRDYFEKAKAVSLSQHTPHDLRIALSWHLKYLEEGSMK